MEFEKGKYYEYNHNSELNSFTHAIVMAQEDRNSSLCMVIKSFDNIHKEGQCNLWGMEIKPINTFDNIHEVSKRIKEIEEKQKFVGLIYECDRSNLSIGDYDHSIVEVVEANYITEQGFDGKVKILKNISVNEEDKHEYKEGNVINYSVMFEYSKQLTREQYEQRVKELEKEEIKKKIKELGWIELIDCDYASKVKSVDDEFVWVVGNANYPLDLVRPITEHKAMSLLTGKTHWELVDDDHDVILRADWDGQEEQIKELQEENKQLRKALVFHGVWPSEDQRTAGNYNEALNLKEASEKAGKACKEYSEAVNNNANREIEAAKKFIKSWQSNPDFQKCEELLDAIDVLENAINNKLQQKANKVIEALENPKGEATGDEMKGLLDMLYCEIDDDGKI